VKELTLIVVDRSGAELERAKPFLGLWALSKERPFWWVGGTVPYHLWKWEHNVTDGVVTVTLGDPVTIAQATQAAQIENR
jgi:hypothetical protein